MRDIPSPEASLRQFLTEVRKSTRLLVAVSGGSDSLGLLHLLHKLTRDGPFPGISLAAATIDHALRAESAAEADTVAAFCKSRTIPHITRRWNDKKPQTGLSAAARDARYRLLADCALEMKADAIVTGHTLDDQIETVTMRALRSSDATVGLAGMATATLYDRRIWILRPLLSCRRTDIRAELTKAGLSWIDDPSNDDADHYERVRTRKALADFDSQTSEIVLEPHFNPEAGAQRRKLAEATAALIRQHATAHAGTVVCFAPEALCADAAALRQALASTLSVTGGRRHLPSQETMDRVMQFIRSDPGARMTAARTLLVRHRNGLYLLRERRDLMSLRLQPGATAIWDDRFQLTNKSGLVIDVEAGADESDDEGLDGLPESLKTHALQVLPKFVPVADTKAGTEHFEAAMACESLLGAHHRYMPAFDRELADALATLFGLKTCLTPPV